MAITGAHVLLYSTEPEKLREVFRDVFGYRFVDGGDGWLIFALPPAELGIHPAESGDVRAELSFMVDDIVKAKAELEAKGMTFDGEPQDHGWGIVCPMHVPGGGTLLVYEPRHSTAT